MVRLRNRYVVVKFNFLNEKNFGGPIIRSHSVTESLNKSIKNLHGVQGIALSKAGLFVHYFNGDTKMGFIKMRRSAYKIVTSAIPLVTSIAGNSVSIRTLYTSATIRHCNIFLAKLYKRELEAKYGSLKSDFQRKEFELELKNCPKIPLKVA